MIYDTADEWRAAPHKRVMLFGMSGLGKTHVSNLLRDSGDWFHYSVDYRIGTRYMGEYIADNFKREAMKVPFLRDLLMSDSVYIASNITFDNLAPLSTYLGKPGSPSRGGLPFGDYCQRQDQHRRAEIASLLDTRHFMDRSRDIYALPHFVCDSGGSICEVVNPDDPDDPVLTALARDLLMVWIKGDEAHTADLVRRFDAEPTPMAYQGQFLDAVWTEYLDQTEQSEEDVDPDAFLRWTYAQALADRQPRYEAMARNWGITVEADTIAECRDEADFVDVIAQGLEDGAAAA